MEKNAIPDPIIVIGFIGFIMIIVLSMFKIIATIQDVRFMKRDIKEVKENVYKLESEIRNLKLRNLKYRREE